MPPARSPGLAALAGLALWLAPAAGARAAGLAPPSAPPAAVPGIAGAPPAEPRSVALFLGGALAGFLMHESGHVVANLAYGNAPRIEEEIEYGFIPFVVIDPGIKCSGGTCRDRDGNVFPGGRRGKLVIMTAGFEVQHLSSEIILSQDPGLRTRRAPFRKGLLAFNVALSLGYAVAAAAHEESGHGDLTNSAQTARVSTDLFAAMLAAPAVLDLYRYFSPESRWAPWASRACKLTFLGVALTL